MVKLRTSRATRTLIALTVGILGSVTPGVLGDADSAESAVTGTVVDGAGLGLAEVQVFVLALDRSDARPAAEVTTAANGRYRIKDLEPGVYRVAAVKEGYLTTFRRVDTMIRKTVDLVLHPLPSVTELEEPLPDNDAWTLRLPRRNVLREKSPETVVAENTEEASAPPPSSTQVDLVDGSVEQMFAVTAGGSSARVADLSGTETRVSLSAALRDRGRIAVRGRRDNFLQGASGTDNGSAEHSNTAFELDVAYDTSLDSTLGVRAFFARNDLDLTTARADQRAQAWGYDANWSKQIDPVSRVEVSVDYTDTALALPDGIGGFHDGVEGGSAEFNNRMMGAETSYQHSPSPNHQLRVGMRAQMLYLPMPAARTAGLGGFSGGPGGAGWSVRLDAEDAWSVNGPLTVVYGVAYHQSLREADWSAVVPRAGAVWSARWFKIKAMVSYHTQGRDPGALNTADIVVQPIENENLVGYDVAIDAPLPWGLRAVGTTSYAPVQYGFAGYELGQQGASYRPIYLTDGNAGTRESSLLLERQFGPTNAWIQVSRGRAEGSLAQVPAFETPVHFLSERSLTYAAGRFGARYGPWGTELRAEFQQVEDQTAAVASPVLPVQKYVELRIVQDLLWLDSAGATWRVLVAARSASSGDMTETLVDESERVSSLRNRQLSAGVSVIF
ncbi:MAG: carboxypeptidase-like regulatory domain-containing protein [Acidobacteriota bacterium]|nr:carboxypeptidase-like regulatory domain-containing protein [Acidobacteriota bacterium]